MRAEGQEVVRGSERYTYCHVPAERFYDDACLRLAASPQISLRLGTRVSSIVDAGTHVRAETAGGAFIGRVAVDTRPRAPDADARLTSLVQHFRGWFVRAAGPVFDPTVVTLMDFDVSQCHGLHFMYVLPFSAEDALVESTYFSAAALAPEAYDEAIARYLSDVYGLRRGAFDVTGAESGAIPMSNALGAGPRGGRIVRAGVAAGAAKPSTGYAFAAIQRASAALADSLLAEPPAPPPSFRSTWTAALDEVFLSWLARAPDAAPRMFRTLFERLPADVAVRFVSGESSLAEDLQAMAASPKRAMTAEAVRALVRYLATGGAR